MIGRASQKLIRVRLEPSSEKMLNLSIKYKTLK